MKGTQCFICIYARKNYFAMFWACKAYSKNQKSTKNDIFSNEIKLVCKKIGKTKIGNEPVSLEQYSNQARKGYFKIKVKGGGESATIKINPTKTKFHRSKRLSGGQERTC